MGAGVEPLVRYIRRLALRPEHDGSTDTALLNRFVSEKDEKAFAALVDRHGALVLQVCRRVLGDAHDAEDAFQAAFLVLIRKAGTLRSPNELAGWLHGVAHRVALKARAARVRRLGEAQRLTEQPVDPHLDPLADLSARELLAVVDEEVRRLPMAYRLPVILCCLEGRSQEEAARQLGWTPGSVKGRLERGRARLSDRLIGRGLTLSAILAATEASRSAASATLVAAFAVAMLRGALASGPQQAPVAGTVSAGAAVLARSVLKEMALARLKLGAGLLLAACVLTTGFLMYRRAEGPSTAAAQSPALPLSADHRVVLAAPASIANKQPPGPQEEEDDTPIAVSGRVVTPDGKPLAGAKVFVVYADRSPGERFNIRQTIPNCTLRATAGADGGFHFTFAKSQLDAPLLDYSQTAVAAVAAGYGLAWTEIGESGKGAELILQLAEDLPVNGRILDGNGKPVAGAKVIVATVTHVSKEDVARVFQEEAFPAR